MIEQKAETSLLRNVRVFYKEGDFWFHVTGDGKEAAINLSALEEPFKETFEAWAREQLNSALGWASDWEN